MCETLNMQSPAGALERINKGGFRCAMCFQSVYPSSLKLESQQQSRSNQSSATVHLSLPLHSLWENRNVKCPASAASGKTQCLQITSEILVLNCLGAWWWRNHGPFTAELETGALPRGLPFSLDIIEASCLLFCPVRWRLSINHRAPPSFSLQCLAVQIFFQLLVLPWGGRAGTPVS